MSKTAVPALVPGLKIVVRNVHIGTLPATIDRSDASSVTVALAVLDDRIKRLVGHELAVEVMSGRGIHRFGGVLTAQNAGSLTVSLSGDVERIQRREFVRIAHAPRGERARAWTRTSAARRPRSTSPAAACGSPTTGSCRSASTSASSSRSPTGTS